MKTLANNFEGAVKAWVRNAGEFFKRFFLLRLCDRGVIFVSLQKFAKKSPGFLSSISPMSSMAVAVARNREAQKSLSENPRPVHQVAGGEGRDVAMARSRARRQDPGQLAQ